LAAVFLFAADFLAAFRRALDFADCFFAAALSVARFKAQRRLVASEIALRPAALNRLLFFGDGDGADSSFEASLPTRSAISRNDDIARSMTARCSSKSEMMRSTLFNDSPRGASGTDCYSPSGVSLQNDTELERL
jgi:hypothetical protein